MQDKINVKEAQRILGIQAQKMAQMLRDGELTFEKNPLNKREKLLDRAEVERLAGGSASRTVAWAKPQPARDTTSGAQPKTIAISNQKGGVGKTATAANLAAFLGREAPTLLIDCDPQGHCARAFGRDASSLAPTLYEVLFEKASIEDAELHLRDDTYLLPANETLAIGEVELRESFRPVEQLHDRLRDAKRIGDFTYVVIDCPPSLGALTVNAMLAADEIIIPVSTTVSYEGALKTVGVVNKLRRDFRRDWGVWALQTFYRRGVLESEGVHKQLAQAFGDRLLSARISLATDISLAMASGEPVLDNPRSRGYQNYRELSEEVRHVVCGQTQDFKRAAS